MEQEKIPEHHFRCPNCGRLVDMRNLAAVMGHELGFSGLERCLTDKQIEEASEVMGAKRARRMGDPEEWVDGKPTNLN